MEEYLTEIQRLCEADAIEVVCKPWPQNDIWVAAEDKNWGDGMYILKIAVADHWTTVARWELWQMKNCCAIQISTKAEVESHLRGRGIGRLCNMIRIESAKRNNYTRLMCTCVLSGAESMPQISILRNNGWKQLDTFENPRTRNTIGVFVHKL
jgi:hypothetical protein